MDFSGFKDILNNIETKEEEAKEESDFLPKDNILENVVIEEKKDIDLEKLQSEVFADSGSKIRYEQKKHKFTIHAGHRQRARDRFLTQLDKISDYDLLELLLFLIIPRADTKPIAKRLIDKYKTLKQVFDTDIETLNNEGINGNAMHYLYNLINITQKRILMQNVNKSRSLSIDNMDDLIKYCQTNIGNLPEEQFRILFLNSKLIVIADLIFGSASVSSVSISLRDVVKKSLDLKATSVVLYHNHPNNDISPSADDIQTTAKLINLLGNIDVEVIDHIIVSGDRWFSFKQEKLIK